MVSQKSTQKLEGHLRKAVSSSSAYLVSFSITQSDALIVVRRAVRAVAVSQCGEDSEREQGNGEFSH
jgi:hypothetical protein